MLSLNLNGVRSDSGDRAVSPVIAVILMVAITVVLAATVYVWVSGFTDTGDQAPNANFRFVNCDPDLGDSEDPLTKDDGWNNVTVRLSAGGPLQLDDTRVILFNRTDDTQEGQTDPINSTGGQWSTGSQKKIADHIGPSGTDADWDSVLTNGLNDGDPYRLDFVHKPTESTYSSLPFTC